MVNAEYVVHAPMKQLQNQQCTAAPVQRLHSCAVCVVLTQLSLSKVLIVVATRIPLQLGTTTVTKKEPLCYPMTYDVTINLTYYRYDIPYSTGNRDKEKRIGW